MNSKNIVVGKIELIWCPAKNVWAIPGMQYEANREKARAIARRMNEAMKGKRQP